MKPNLIDQGPIHVRLFELFGLRYLEAEVAADGKFAFSGSIEGKYILVVLQHDKVLATELLSVKPSLHHPVIEILLKQPPPEFKENQK